MFRCEDCGEVKTGRPIKVVVETREKQYEHKIGNKTTYGQGWEIAKEKITCEECNKETYGKE